MKGNNPWHSLKIAQSLPVNVVGVATSNGVTISEPWRDGRWLTFILMTGAVVGSITFHWEVQKRSDDSWKDLMDSAGTPADVTVVGAADTTVLANINLDDIDSETYKAIRVQVTGTNAADEAAAVHIISDLAERAGGDAEGSLSAVTMPFTYEA